MALIIGVMLALILLFKFAGDKAGSASYEQKFKRHMETKEERMAKWKAEACDPALEEDLSYFIRDPYKYKEVWGEVSDAYSHMPLHKGISSIPLNMITAEKYYGKSVPKKRREEHVEENRKEVLHIMLARRGKVMKQYTDTDLLLDGFGSGIGEHTKRDWEKKYEFWMYIYDELLRHGVHARLLFIVYDSERKTYVAYDYKDVPKYSPGHIKWFQQTTYSDDLKRKL
jgi:hypothetical protein